VVRALWEARDEIAEQRDVTPGRIIPDSAIIVAAQTMPVDKAALMSTKGFHGRGADRYSNRWVQALREVAEMEEADLPTRSPRGDGPPLPRAWAEKDPVAARRLAIARDAMSALAEENHLPVENLLTPDYLRRTLWTPPKSRDAATLTPAVAEQLAGYGARPWQIELTSPVLVEAIIAAEVEPVIEPEPDHSSEDSDGLSDSGT
jgi:ribonuclease D